MPKPSPEREFYRSVEHAVQLGYHPVPILARQKRTTMSGWNRLRYDSVEEAREKFSQWHDQGFTNLGIQTGADSANLIDVDLDHGKAVRFSQYFLPRTPAVSGRENRPHTHFWYIAEEGTLPSSRAHKMPRGADGSSAETSVELRSSNHYTVIPPSVHPDGDRYIWHGEPWGGAAGPTVVNGKQLAAQVALIGLGAVLLDGWPSRGGRHDAYLALAGGLLRYGDGVHEYWEKNAAVLISVLAEVTNDDDGPEARVAETIEPTLKRLRQGRAAQGWPALAEIIGSAHVEQARRLVADIEQASGYSPKSSPNAPTATAELDYSYATTSRAQTEDEEPSKTDPLEARVSTWEPVNLDPYLAGQVMSPEPTICERSDGHYLMYQGRVNMLYGSSESAKSWIALNISMQEINKGERVLYLDFEDEPINTLNRLKLMGAHDDDLRLLFTYIRPEGPLAPMQRNKWGQFTPTDLGKSNMEAFTKAIDSIDPSLIIADGMTVLYGLHGLDSNDASSTDTITNWLKKLTRNGRSTVIIIDHTIKNAERGSLPLGSQHKVAMVQGSMLQAWPIRQPMPGSLGEVELVVLKDRPGAVRAVSLEAGENSKAQVSANVVLDSREMHRTVVTIAPPAKAADVEFRDNLQILALDLSRSQAGTRQVRRYAAQEAVLGAFGGEIGRILTRKQIMSELSGSFTEEEVSRALRDLEQKSFVINTGRGKGKRYILQISS